ncbi:16122_t:CDS:2 [Entrophospora sp. SA101]|nr:16122_t:CDS:2 [Entrophospora sp. SA101]
MVGIGRKFRGGSEIACSNACMSKDLFTIRMFLKVSNKRIRNFTCRALSKVRDDDYIDIEKFIPSNLDDPGNGISAYKKCVDKLLDNKEKSDSLNLQVKRKTTTAAVEFTLVCTPSTIGSLNTNEGDDDDPDTVILVNENVRSDEEIEKEI